MTEDKEKFPKPSGLCDICIKGAAASWARDNAATIINYCEHNQTLGILMSGLWLIIHPMSREVFDLTHKIIATPDFLQSFKLFGLDGMQSDKTSWN